MENFKYFHLLLINLILLNLALSVFGASNNSSTGLSVCGYPGNNANSLTNFTGSWVNPGTVITYACDAGYKMFPKSEHRVCQHDGTWTSEAPICAKSVSFGKNMTCTSPNCVLSDTNMLMNMIDDTDSTCFSVKSSLPNDVSNWRLDLLEEFEIRVLRFVFRGKAAQYVNLQMTLEDARRSARVLKHTECTIDKGALPTKGGVGGGYVITIIPNHPQWARYVNINIKHQHINEEIAFCETQIFADSAPSVHQCFNPSTVQDDESVQSPADNTIIYKGKCYTFDSKLEDEWSRKQEQCKIVYQGDLIHDVTDDVNGLLSNYATSKGTMNTYWMGGYVEKRPSPSAKGGYDYVPVWISRNRINNPLLDVKPDHCLAFAAPKGIWMFFPCHYRTGSLCQSDIKRCGNPELKEYVKVTPVWQNNIGVTIQHYCPAGYGLDGDERRTCQNNGKWSGSPPTCVNGGVKDKFSWTTEAIVGVTIAILIGLCLIVLVVVIILRKHPTFKHKLSFHSESVENLESGKQKEKKNKERSSLNAATGSAGGAQNYETLLSQETQQTKQQSSS